MCMYSYMCMYVYMYMFIYYLVDGSYFSNDFGHTWYQSFDHNYSWRGVASDIYLDNVYATTFEDGKFSSNFSVFRVSMYIKNKDARSILFVSYCKAPIYVISISYYSNNNNN